MKEFNFYFILFILLFPKVCFSLDSNKQEEKRIFINEYHFIRGYQEFIDKNYALAADIFFQAISSEAKGNLLNRSYLYLSLCQFKLRDINNATYNASYIETKMLSKKDLILFNRLKESLGGAYEKAREDKLFYDKIANSRHFYFSPYYGRSAFSGLPERDLGVFFGLGVGTSKKNFSIFLSAELLDLQSTKSNTSYEQKLFNFKISTLNKNQNYFYSFLSNIQSPMKSQDGISVFGFGNEIKFRESVNLFSELAFSNYPNFIIKPLFIPQLTAGSLVKIFSKNLKSYFFKVGFQTNSIPSFEDTDSTIKSGTHFKYFTELIFKIDQFSITPGFWAGSEFFGVRNQGALIFSGLEQHLVGQSLKFDFPVTKSLWGQINVISEKIKMNENIGSSQTFFGSLSLTTF